MTTAAGQVRPHSDGVGRSNNPSNNSNNGQVNESAKIVNKQLPIYNNHQDTNNIMYNKTIHHNHLALKSNHKPNDQYRNDHISRRNILTEEDDDEPQAIDEVEDGNLNEENYQFEDEESLSEALLAVASAEEYAAKIAKLQQACLTPLKEGLADWLNKVLKTSSITTENFMDKLDNGVIICRLAKIISLWCAQQLETNNVNSTSGYKRADVGNYQLSPVPRPRLSPFTNGPLRAASSQSTNCLASAPSTTSLNQHNGYSSQSSQFLDNLIQMHQAKIWEDARGRTFYARDNVCNFIKWSRDFGVNQSVLFESDDLVLHENCLLQHNCSRTDGNMFNRSSQINLELIFIETLRDKANPRQVVLCLLDVSRIAYVKYGFTEAPGLVKFEQEIDKGLIATRKDGSDLHIKTVATYMKAEADTNVLKESTDENSSSRAKNLRSISIGDATDELVLRYCKHKKEEAARRRSEQSDSIESDKRLDVNYSDIHASILTSLPIQDNSHLSKGSDNRHESTTVSLVNDLMTHNKKSLADTGRIDSLDSGQGPTESASTGHSAGLVENELHSNNNVDTGGFDESKPEGSHNQVSSSVNSQHTSSMSNSEISSSRSSLLSNQDGANPTSSGFGRQITSDLDGKVMRIAKSYYGKGATKDVTRLSEGKYKIADRIVFVRLLKGHRVMVRIGGGWDTLENFLFRHKSDPSQVIDVDNLLPLETKMSFEKSPQVTPTNGKISKLPNYRRSNSSSSTNLSMSNLSVSNHSISSNNTPSTKAIGVPVFHKQISSSVQSSPAHHRRQNQIPQLFIHKNQLIDRRQMTPQCNPTSPNKTGQGIIQASHPADSTSFLKRPLYYQYSHKTTPFVNKYDQHYSNSLASSKAPASSASNLFPATLTTRLGLSPAKSLSGSRSLSSANNLNNSAKLKPINKQQVTFRNIGCSDESLQASSYKSPQHHQIVKSNGIMQQAQTETNGIGIPKPRFLSRNPR